jgi:hypothetical protein
MKSAALGLSVVVVTLLACKSDPKAEAANRADIDRVTQKLAKVVAAVPDPTALDGSKVCNDAEIKANYKAKEQKLWLTGVDYEFLRGATAGTAPPDKDPWAFLNSPGISDHLLKAREKTGTPLGNAAFALRNVESARYVVVFRAAERSMPKVDGEEFDSGIFDGQLVIMDLETATPVCHALLEVESSDVVEYNARGITGKSDDRAIRDDLEKQFEKTATKALRSIAKEAVVGLSGITLE